MMVPNSLGHYHRDITKVVSTSRWYVKVGMSCGHTKELSKQAYAKYKDHATLCVACEPKDVAAEAFKH
jgi:hypothetical protein